MLRRGPIVVNRKRGLGLLGTMAVGGVAYATGSNMAKRTAQNEVQNEQIVELQAQQDALMQQQAMAQQRPPGYVFPPANPSPPPGAAAASTDRIAQLKQLAELKEAGVLTEEEFQQEKQRILASG